MAGAADLKEYQTVVDTTYRTLLENIKSNIDSGSTYEYNSSDYEGPFDNLSQIAFPKAELSIIAGFISGAEMYDDLLALERASIVGELGRDDYYDLAVTEIDTELKYLDNRSAIFQKHIGLVDKYKNSQQGV